jgi:hypothetical protein
LYNNGFGFLMNIRDPFNIHRSPAIRIFQLTAATAAQTLSQKVLETSKQAVESGRQKLEAMSFNIPRNVPSFNNPQRELENRAWGASGVTSRSGSGMQGGYGLVSSNGGMAAVQDKVGGFFDRSRDLPMYKDKPYSYAASRRQRGVWRRKRTLGILSVFIFFILYLFGAFDGSQTKEKAGKSWAWLQKPETSSGVKVDWLSRRERVVEAFTLSWDAYERYAWGAFRILSFERSL